LLFRTLPKRAVETVLLPFFESTPARLVGGILFHPVTCWLAATITVLGWHDPATFELAVRSAVWHEIQLLSFIAAGLLFWWPVMQQWPSAARWSRWSIPFYLFFATLPCDALSAFLTFCDRVVPAVSVDAKPSPPFAAPGPGVGGCLDVGEHHPYIYDFRDSDHAPNPHADRAAR
jgi:cytochrome c oxidase assembly factor CtaG